MSFELNSSLSAFQTKQYVSISEVIDEQIALLNIELGNHQTEQITKLQKQIAECEENIRKTSVHLAEEQKNYEELQNKMTACVKSLQPDQIPLLVPKMSEIASRIQIYIKQCEVFRNNIAMAQKEIANQTLTVENERSRIQTLLQHLEFGKKLISKEINMDLSNDFSNNNSNVSNNSNINAISKNNSKSTTLSKNKAPEIKNSPNKKLKQENHKGSYKPSCSPI